MNHDEAERLLGPYRDGEMDLGTCLELEEHLAGCPSCQQKLAEERELVDFIQAEGRRFEAPPFLKARIRAALRQEGAPAETSWWRGLSSIWMYSGLAGAAAVCGVLAAGFFWTGRIPALAQEAVADHVRSLQVSHLVDVPSTDQHTVKPWFAGKLDYSPQVIDLGPSGYPLIGGRLDVLDRRTVAAIVYQRRKHTINLFVWPADAGARFGRSYTLNGYHIVRWTRAGMNYLAVSDLAQKELEEFSKLIEAQTVPAG